MSTIPPFSSVPGQLYPGEGQPGLVGQGGASAYFPYYGHLVLCYLDYLNAGTGETLVAVPGGSYLMMPVNSRHGLTVPPPDGRWNPSTVKDFIVFHPPGSAAWDREAHRRLAALPPPSLAEVRAAIGPGFIPLPLVPSQKETPVTFHPPGSASWDRVAHFRRPDAVVPAVSLAEARAASGPGVVPDVVIPAQRDIVHVAHAAGSAAWDRTAHATLKPSVASQPSLAEVRVAIEAAKTERGFWDTGPAVPQPAVVSGGKAMPLPEPTELQRIRAALAAKAAVLGGR